MHVGGLRHGQAQAVGQAAHAGGLRLLQRRPRRSMVRDQRGDARIRVQRGQGLLILRVQLQQQGMALVAQARGLGQGRLPLSREQVEHRRLVLRHQRGQHGDLTLDHRGAAAGPRVQAVALAGTSGLPPLPCGPARVNVVDRLARGHQVLRQPPPVVARPLNAPRARLGCSARATDQSRGRRRRGRRRHAHSYGRLRRW